MKFRYEILPLEGYLSVRCEGNWDPKASRECWRQVLQSLRQHGTDRVLFDDRDIELETDPNIDFEHAEFVAETLGGVGRKIAIVDKSKNDESNSFFETVCVNRGLRVRFFSDPASALDWLLP